MKESAWGSRASLEQYFPEDSISADEVMIQKYIIAHLKKVGNSHIERMLDFGAGPTVHRLVPFVPFVKRIDVAEYLPESLRDIKYWIDGEKGSRNWDVYIKKTLELEGGASDTRAITRRRSLLIKKIGAVIRGDIRKSAPLGKKVTYPLVTSFYCADAITTSKRLWKSYMHNLASLVEAGGWLILTVSRDTNHSLLNGHRMPNVRLVEKDIHDMFAAMGFNMKTFRQKKISAAMWSEIGISNVLFAVAQKK